MTKRVFKDREPAETIGIIRNILSRIGIFAHESCWHSIGGQAFSVRIQDDALGIGVNGKGVTRPYALASAYAELMERIQNLALIGKDFGLMTDHGSFYPDATLMSFSELLQHQPRVMNHLVAAPVPQHTLEEYDREGVVCVPFYNATDDQVELLPLDLVEMACQTNGLCAGNTPAEALVQGLSEIAERSVIFRIFSEDNLELPVVPRERFANLGVNDLLSAVEAACLNVVIKDCSWGGRVPVLAALISDVQRSRYIVSLGADPCFETAVERCITEAFQGADDLSWKGKPFDLCYSHHLEKCYSSDFAQRQYAMFCALMTTEGHYPDGFFINGGSLAVDRVFLREFTGSRESLRFLVNLFHQDHQTIYVRDVSFLGFPAYRVYVPGITEFVVLNRDRPLFTPSELKLMVRCSARLTDCRADDLAKLVSMVEGLGDYPLFHRQKWRRRIDPRLHLAPISDFVTQFWGPAGAEKFLALGNLRLGNYLQAARYWQEYITSSPEPATAYETCCLAYLRLRARGVRSDGLRKRFNDAFDSQLIEKVISDLDDDDGFKNLRLPLCGDCTACPVTGQCLYPRWRIVSDRLREQARNNQRDQMALRYLFRE